MNVSLFITCVCDMFHPKVGKDTAELLERFGCEVDFPTAQTCCGQPAYNSGYLNQAKKAMKQMILAFEHADYIVGPSSSSVGMLREYPTIFQDGPIWADKATEFAKKHMN